ncbi:hypothetical protein Ahia01_000625300 [Argonauta hians]
MLSGYLYGYMTTNFVGSMLAHKYGGKRVAGFSILSASILAILHPCLSRISGYLTLALRILTGCVSGPILPSLISLIGFWAPPDEIGTMTGIVFAGQLLGSSICYPVSGYLCVYGFDHGWGSIFYIFGGVSMMFSCVWFYVVYDNPDVHPNISKKERYYLRNAIHKTPAKKVPWKRMLSSSAFWAIVVALIAFSWTQDCFPILLPLYMKEALHVETTANGWMLSAFSAGQLLCFPLTGKFADCLLSRKCISTRYLRVLFQHVCLTGSACILISIALLQSSEQFVIMILLVFSGITLTFAGGGVLVNNNDIAPNYSGIIFGIANTFASLASATSSLIAKILTPNGTKEEWQVVFMLFAAVAVVGAILFTLMAKGDIQDWAIEETESNAARRDSNTVEKF